MPVRLVEMMREMSSGEVDGRIDEWEREAELIRMEGRGSDGGRSVQNEGLEMSPGARWISGVFLVADCVKVDVEWGLSLVSIGSGSGGGEKLGVLAGVEEA